MLSMISEFSVLEKNSLKPIELKLENNHHTFEMFGKWSNHHHFLFIKKILFPYEEIIMPLVNPKKMWKVLSMC